MNTVRAEMDIKTVERVERQMQDAIHHFNTLDRSANDIKIYMPEYFKRILNYQITIPAQYEKLTHYNGIDVADGYENKVIVSVKNNVIYNIEPIVIEL